MSHSLLLLSCLRLRLSDGGASALNPQLIVDVADSARHVPRESSGRARTPVRAVLAPKRRAEDCPPYLSYDQSPMFDFHRRVHARPQRHEEGH
jgi:hypothetical protein